MSNMFDVVSFAWTMVMNSDLHLVIIDFLKIFDAGTCSTSVCIDLGGKIIFKINISIFLIKKGN